MGKSHTIRELMGPSEDRPFVQASSTQRASTTANINLYACHTLVPKCTVHFLDYEGEHGSEAPVALNGGGSSGSGSGSSGGSGGSSLLAHHLKLSGAGVRGGSGSGSGSGPTSLLEEVLGKRVMPPSISSSSSGGEGAGSSSSSSSSGGGSGGGSASEAVIPRSVAVADTFPKLAYTTSDVVVMVGTEPFFSTRYLERVLSFAMRANSGVGDADLPILLLLCNRRDADACILDIKASTAQFYEAMGESVNTLDQFFSAILAVYLPNRRSVIYSSSSGGEGGGEGQQQQQQPQPPTIIADGATLYSEQIGKVRACLAALMQSRLLTRYGAGGVANGSGGGGGAAASMGAPTRAITARQGLWYELLPRVVREINSGKTVSVMRLVDEAWNAALAAASCGGAGSGSGSGDLGARVGDALKSFSVCVRPPPLGSCKGGAPELLNRFDAYLTLVTDLGVRVAASHMRGLPAPLRIPERTLSFATSTLRLAVEVVDECAPCRAEYSGPPVTPCKDGLPPGSGIVCLQERRAHTKGHRSSRRVTGGGGKTFWDKVANTFIAHTPVWAGPWQAPLVHSPDVPKLAATAVELSGASPMEWHASLLALGRRNGAGEFFELVWGVLEGGGGGGGTSGAAASASTSTQQSAADTPSSAAAAAAIPPPPKLMTGGLGKGGSRLNFSPTTIIPLSTQPYCCGCCKKVPAPPSSSSTATTAPHPLKTSAPPMAPPPTTASTTAKPGNYGGILSFLGGSSTTATSSLEDASTLQGGKQKITLGLCKQCVQDLGEIGLIC